MDAVMAKFPAMQLSQAELVEHFPAPNTLKQMARTGTALPTDPTLHAVYADAMANYDAQIAAAGITPSPENRGKKKQAATAMPAANTMGDDPAAANMAPAAAGDADMAMTPAAAVTKGKGKARLERVDYNGQPVDQILAMSPDDRMAALIAMPPAEAAAFRRQLGPMRTAMFAKGLSPAQLETVAAMQGPIRVVGAEALQSRIMRDVFSDRQLEAVMTDFWLNHFNVYVRKNQNEAFLLPSYERDTIRPHALGKFEDLLVATAESPAMLMYLDNWQSIGPDSPAATRGKKFQQFADANPNRVGVQQIAQITPKGINENYAREIIELHTIGVGCEVSADKTTAMLPNYCGHGYTQTDVTNLAKVLTGWTIQRPYGGRAQGPQGTGSGDVDSFTFQENRHEGGSKQVLGATIEPGGMNEGLQVLHMLATSPATAAFYLAQAGSPLRVAIRPPPRSLEEAHGQATFLKPRTAISSVGA